MIEIDQSFVHVKFISNLIKFNLNSGPFITGSYMTWLLEKRFNNPNWFPDDLDICCISKKQFQNVQHILEPLATNINETNWLGSNSTYWTIDNFKYQAFVHPVSVQERITWTDFSITSIASDGVNFLMQHDTMDDIKNKILRYHDKINEYPRPLASMKDRYEKYVSRGYTDPDNETLTKLRHLHEIWPTL